MAFSARRAGDIDSKVSRLRAIVNPVELSRESSPYTLDTI